MDTQNPSAPLARPVSPCRQSDLYASPRQRRRHSREHPPHHPLRGDRQPPGLQHKELSAPGHRPRLSHPVAAHGHGRRHQVPHRPLPQGPTRVAAALRELETYGYLRREVVRTPTGRIVTRTVSCNQPTHRREAADTGCSDQPARQLRPAVERTPQPRPPHGTRTRARKALPAVPQPSSKAPSLQAATDLLTGRRRHDSRLLLSAAETAHLAPGVATWLERDIGSTAVRQALTADLPDEPLRRPAALLAHRLTDRLPPPAPFRAPTAAPHHSGTSSGTARAATAASAPPKRRIAAATAGQRNSSMFA